MSGWATAATLAVTTVSTAASMASASQQAQQQSAMADYQGQVARENQKLAEEQASAEKRQGYENMQAKRLETAQLIGRQRAAAGASGTTVDVGSGLDVQQDTAARGEMEAINAYNQGVDRAYNASIQAWNYGSQASAADATASNAGAAGASNMLSAGLGGIASMGTTWGNYMAKNGSTGGMGTANHSFGAKGYTVNTMGYKGRG